MVEKDAFYEQLHAFYENFLIGKLVIRMSELNIKKGFEYLLLKHLMKIFGVSVKVNALKH